MNRNIHHLLLVLACMATQPACMGLMYSAEPTEAKVVDADTKQPLEGVVVTANWQLEKGTLAGSVQAGQLMVMEAVTDRDGKFAFPGFGPKLAVTSRLVDEDPRLLFFKSGYRYLELANEYNSSMELRTHYRRHSDWNGKTIEMKPFRGTVEEYVKNLERFYYSLDHVATGQPEDCNWKKLPKAIIALAQERKALEGKVANLRTIPSLDTRLLSNDEYFTSKGGQSCGSPKIFLRSIMP